MNSIELIQAQAQAAKQCIAILTEAQLIGSELVSKLPAARAAILSSLPKLYAVCKEVERTTGKNMYRVSSAICNMYARAKWADHDKMMDAVEADLVAFVSEAEAIAAPVSAEDLEEGQQVMTSVGSAVVVGHDKHSGEVKVKFNNGSGCTTTKAENLHPVNFDHMAKIESLLKAEGIDFMDEESAVACLAQTVLPTKNVALYREELSERRHTALMTTTTQGIKAQLANLEEWAAKADNREKNEWVMACGHSPICYRVWVEDGKLNSAPMSVFEAPALALTMGNELAVKVEAQRGHSVGLRRRMNVVQQDIETCKKVLASLGVIL
ncbi:MAG: hypothetical protein ACRCXB_23010 [Aeromonadaceae bacterium]